MDDLETAEGVVHGFRPDDLLDKAVYDVNGHLLGRVRLCRERGDRLASFDVELTERARRALAIEARQATLLPDDLLSAEEDVTLREEAAILLHPEIPHPGHLDPSAWR